MAYISLDTDDAVTRSCELAVLMVAASMAMRSIPAITGLKRASIISMYTVSPSARSGMNAFPTMPTHTAAVSVSTTHTIAILLEVFILSEFSIAMNLTRICG